MKTFLDEQFSDLEKELKMTNKSKSLLRNKVLQSTVIINKPNPKNNRVWQYTTLTAILTAAVILFLTTQLLNTLRHTANNASYINEMDIPTEIKMMDEIVVQDTIEFMIQSNNFGKIIHPSNAGPTSDYLVNGNNDETYLDILVTVRNLSLTELSEADRFMRIEIIYDEREAFNSFTRFERESFERVGESKFTNLNNSVIQPLETRVVHFLTSVPSSIEKDGKPLKAVITVNGENYAYVIR